MMTTYHAVSELPALVACAEELAHQMGFEQSCLPEVGRLLAVLTASIGRGTIGELGTGTGVGAA